MRKQASIGSILESFQTFYADPKTASHDALQGCKETSVSTPATDSEVNAILPSDGSNVSNLATERGVDTEETLPDAAKNLPEQKLERKLTSPSEKIAALSNEDLVNQLKSKLTKIANGEKPEAPKAVEAPVVEAPKVAATANDGSVDINIDALAAKTAAFIQASEQGYNMARTIFNPTTAAPVKTASHNQAELPSNIEELVSARVEQLKTAGWSDEQIVQQLVIDGEADSQSFSKEAQIADHVRSNDAAFVESKIAAFVNSGVLSPQQAEVVLTELGFPTETAKIANIEVAVDNKVASLRNQYPGITDEQIMGVLEKDAEADAEQAMAEQAMMEQAAAEQGAEGAPVEAGIEGGAEAGAEGGEASEEEIGQALQVAIAELQAAVEAGQMTEEEALQMLEQSGLDVQGMLEMAAQAQGGMEGAPVEGAPVEGAPMEGAPAEGEIPPELAAELAAAEGGAPEEQKEASVALETLIANLDAATASGGLTQKQASAMLAALAA